MKKNLTVNELLQAKAKLENTLLASTWRAIRDFKEEMGVGVTSVSVDLAMSSVLGAIPEYYVQGVGVRLDIEGIV